MKIVRNIYPPILFLLSHFMNFNPQYANTKTETDYNIHIR